MNSRETIARIGRAEREATLSLHRAAAATCSAGTLDIDGVDVVWSCYDGDPGYASVENLQDAPDPHALLPAIEEAFCARGGPVLGVKVSPAIDPRLGADHLQERGYQLDFEESVWARYLDARPIDLDVTASPPLELVEASDRDAFASVFNHGRGLPAAAMPGRIVASAIGYPGWLHYIARPDSEDVEGAIAALFISDGVANFFVSTTTPEYRENGTQRATIRRRLADALSAGCDVAISQTIRDDGSSRDLHEHGFQTLYQRWIYGKRLQPAVAGTHVDAINDASLA